jgi:hypothetical protein
MRGLEYYKGFVLSNPAGIGWHASYNGVAVDHADTLKAMRASVDKLAKILGE